MTPTRAEIDKLGRRKGTKSLLRPVCRFAPQELREMRWLLLEPAKAAHDKHAQGLGVSHVAG
jgi:hypothetical protein